MGQLGDALRAAARPLEARLRARDAAILRDGLSDTLPQSWRFVTESEVAVLRLGTDGHVAVLDDVAEPPNVIVQWTQHELVAALLSGRSNELDRPNPPRIRFATASGRKAWSLVGTSLGL